MIVAILATGLFVCFFQIDQDDNEVVYVLILWIIFVTNFTFS